RITHLMEDPKEREPVNQPYVRWGVMQHAHRVVREFEESKKREELIPSGSPIDFVPRPYARGQPVPPRNTPPRPIDEASNDRTMEGGLRLHSRDVKASIPADESNRGSMIWIPGGSFLMGSNAFYREERPVRRETVQGFWIDRDPVTNAK